MLNELPQTFRFVLVNYVDSSAHWFLDRWSFLGQIITPVFFLKSRHLVRPVEDDGDVSVGKVHVAVCFAVVDPETVVIVYHVSHVLVGTMRIQSENKVAGQLLRQLQLEGSLANIRSHEDAAEVIPRLDVPKHHFCSVGHVDSVEVLLVSVLAFQIAY